MPGLLAALNSSAATLEAFQQALNIVQNNVSNVSTLGYAAQVAKLKPAPFDPAGGPAGGVLFTGAQSLRDENSERYLQQQSSLLGNAQAIGSGLSSLNSTLSISTASGVPGALTGFSSSLSALSQDPNNVNLRQQVLTSAQNVVQAFQGAASAVSQSSADADQQITSTVGQINTLAYQIQQLNQKQATNSVPDPNVDASLHADLDTLSGLVNFTSSFAGNGTVTISLGGQTTLVANDKVYPISTALTTADPLAPEPNGIPSRAILDSEGKDITSQTTGGALGGLLQVRNTILAGIRGDTNQPGSLNVLAKGFADRVNNLLTGGQISAPQPPLPGVPGVALFQYNTLSDTNVARSLSLTSITAQQIAAIDPGPPSVANGIATRLGNLANSTLAADQINGQSATSYYAQLTTDFGNHLSSAINDKKQQSLAVAQAQNLLSQTSGVSLDKEAVNLVQLQNSYQATSKLVNVIDQLLQATIGLIR